MAAGAACLLIVRHYREHYGRVSTSRRQGSRDLAAIALAVALVIGGAVLLRDVPVNAVAVAFALAMAAGYAVGPGLTTHHAVICGALLVAGAIPVWDGRVGRDRGTQPQKQFISDSPW